MKMNKKGFTLIELLVVVLIIGILAAIALPQYFKAVEKSKSAEALMVIGSIVGAEQRYQMVNPNNDFTTNFADLDIEFDGASGATLSTNNYTITLGSTSVSAERPAGAKYPHTLSREYTSRTIHCTGDTNNICPSLGNFAS